MRGDRYTTIYKTIYIPIDITMFINTHQQLMMVFFGCNGSEIGKAPESTAPAGKAKEQMFEAEVRHGVFAMPIFFAPPMVYHDVPKTPSCW